MKAHIFILILLLETKRNNIIRVISVFTLPETNIAPENGWMEY